MSQHIGDLENLETLTFFEETLDNLKKLFRVEPCAVAHDLHPLYLSTRFAMEMRGVRQIGVQHHHAHIASCMAENGLSGETIGVALDGTGYGTDGRIWGGEFLAAGYHGFVRHAHFRYIPLAGGDTAVREPWRAALAYLIDTFGENPPGLLGSVPEQRLAMVRRMIATGLNTVQTSSCGRLFDAVAATDRSPRGSYVRSSGRHRTGEHCRSVGDRALRIRHRARRTDAVDFRPAIARIAAEVVSGNSPSSIAARFHNTVAAAVGETCRRIRAQTGLNRVCLSGGVFQNMRLLAATTNELRGAAFQVFLHAKVPPNDGGIALGQAVIAAATLRQAD